MWSAPGTIVLRTSARLFFRTPIISLLWFIASGSFVPEIIHTATYLSFAAASGCVVPAQMGAMAAKRSAPSIAANKQPGPEDTGGYWPSYLFNNGKVGQRVAPVLMPIGGGAVGMGGRAHAANEFYVIEGAGKTYGMAGAEKSIATVLYNYAGLN